MALVNGGFLHYTDMKKFLKNLFLRNRWSDFEIILQESGFDISRHLDCPIWVVLLWANCCHHLGARWASKIFDPLLLIRVLIADTGI